MRGHVVDSPSKIWKSTLSNLRNCIELIQWLSHLRRRNCLGAVPGQDEGLLMQVFHGGGAEDDEEPHPKGGALEWNGLIGLSLIGLVV